MGSPAIVTGDRVTGQCPNHMIPNPSTGAPIHIAASKAAKFSSASALKKRLNPY